MAPRSLKLPVICWCSSLRWTGTPVCAVSTGDGTSGVRTRMRGNDQAGAKDILKRRRNGGRLHAVLGIRSPLPWPAFGEPAFLYRSFGFLWGLPVPLCRWRPLE